MACAVLALAFCDRLSAQQPPDTTRLADLVVTATRLEQSRSAVPAAVTVITGQELRARGFRFLADWLAGVPGATVVRTGSYGGVTSLFLRGGESDYTKVLVDGVAVNQPGGSIDFGNLSVEDVERIELVSGPAGVLYGSDAVTGVIQVFTRRAEAGRASLEARGGNFATSDLRGSAAGGLGGLRWSGGVTRFGSEGSGPFNSQYRSWTATGRAALAAGGRTDLALSGRYGDHLSHFPTDFTGIPVDSNQYTSERGLTVAVDGGHRLTDAIELRLLASLFDSRRGFDDRPDGPADTVGYGYASVRNGVVKRRSLDLRGNYRPSDGVVLTAGAELVGESEQVTDRTDSNYGDGGLLEQGQFNASRQNTAFYGQGLVAIGTVADLQLGARLDVNEVFGSFATWRTGAVVRPVRPVRLRAALGTSFKQPTFSEQFATTLFETGNPGLVPERVFSWEAGAEVSLAGERVTLTATWFDQAFRDLIQYRFTEPGEPSYANVAAATAQGLELGAGWLPSSRLELSVQWTGMETRVDQAGPGAGPGLAPGEPLLRRPSTRIQAAARVRPGGGSLLVLDASYTGEREDMDYRAFPASRLTLPAFTVVNLSADWPLPSSGVPVAVTFRLSNLLGERYQPVVGFEGQGRAVLAGVRLGR